MQNNQPYGLVSKNNSLFVVLEKKTTFPCITLARCSVGNTDALGHLYIKKTRVTTQNVHSHPHVEVQKGKDYIIQNPSAKVYG